MAKREIVQLQAHLSVRIPNYHSWKYRSSNSHSVPQAARSLLLSSGYITHRVTSKSPAAACRLPEHVSLMICCSKFALSVTKRAFPLLKPRPSICHPKHIDTASFFVPRSLFSTTMAAKADMPYAEYRQLGKSGLRVSVPILGAMSIGDKRWQPWVLEEDEALPLLKAAYDRGLNSVSRTRRLS